jgi:hypothetical protein
MTTETDKRKFTRHPAKLDMKFRFHGSLKDGIIQNLSLGGVLFRTKTPLFINSPIEFIFDLPIGERFKRCVLHGRVLRVREDPYGFWPEIGCQFAYSSAKSLALLREFFTKGRTIELRVKKEKSKKKNEDKFKFKDPRRPTWWTHPGTSLSKINQALLGKKKRFTKKIKEVLLKLFKR